MEKLAKINISEIIRLHNEIEQSLKISLDKAIRIGELLSNMKAELKHGQFTSWIKENLPFSDRTARRYMDLFENNDKILKSGSIAAAYKMLENSKTDSVSVLRYEDVYNKANQHLDILKIVSKDLLTSKDLICVLSNRIHYESSLRQYIEILRGKIKISEEKKEVADIIRAIVELGSLQNLISEIVLWDRRILGQIMALK